MKGKVLALIGLLSFVAPAMAQQRLVDEVKKDISAMTLTVDNYKNSLKKINKALENADTREKAEPWWVAGKIQFFIYDKMMNNKAAGEKIKQTDAAIALIDGYDKFQVALSKDTIFLADKRGNPIIDKKTKKRKFKTKYSKDIVNRVLEHLVDYSAAAGDFYLAGDWANAYKAWDIYCNTAQSKWAKKRKIAEADTIIGYNRFFQGLAAYQNNEYTKAVEKFADARNHNYRKKGLYDAWIDALLKVQDTIYLVSVAHEAHQANFKCRLDHFCIAELMAEGIETVENQLKGLVFFFPFLYQCLHTLGKVAAEGKRFKILTQALKRLFDGSLLHNQAIPVFKEGHL